MFLAFPAISQHPRPLPQRHDPAWPAIHRFFVSTPRNPVITGKGSFDVTVHVVPLLDHVRKIELAPRSHVSIGEQTKNIVKRCRNPSQGWNQAGGRG